MSDKQTPPFRPGDLVQIKGRGDTLMVLPGRTAAVTPKGRVRAIPTVDLVLQKRLIADARAAIAKATEAGS